jgi:hypothetical protein
MTWQQLFVILGVVAAVFTMAVVAFKVIDRCRCDRKDHSDDAR